MPDWYLFSSKSCPFAHRCEIFIKLFDLKIEVIYCDPIFTFKDGWKIIGDNNPTSHTWLKDLYVNFPSKYQSLPVLYDHNIQSIVSNDSREIIKLLAPSEVLTEMNENIYAEFNEKIVVGTYKAGHAKTYNEHEKYVRGVHEYLDRLEGFIGKNTTILLDIIIYCHLIRYDLVFIDLFSLDGKHLWEYPNIYAYLQKLYKIKAFHEATDLLEIKRGSYLTENNLPQNLWPLTGM